MKKSIICIFSAAVLFSANIAYSAVEHLFVDGARSSAEIGTTSSGNKGTSSKKSTSNTFKSQDCPSNSKYCRAPYIGVGTACKGKYTKCACNLTFQKCPYGGASGASSCTEDSGEIKHNRCAEKPDNCASLIKISEIKCPNAGEALYCNKDPECPNAVQLQDCTCVTKANTSCNVAEEGCITGQSRAIKQ